MEATHVTDKERLRRLLVLMVLAFCWAYRTGQWLTRWETLKIKKYGRLDSDMDLTICGAYYEIRTANNGAFNPELWLSTSFEGKYEEFQSANNRVFNSEPTQRCSQDTT